MRTISQEESAIGTETPLRRKVPRMRLADLHKDDMEIRALALEKAIELDPGAKGRRFAAGTRTQLLMTNTLSLYCITRMIWRLPPMLRRLLLSRGREPSAAPFVRSKLSLAWSLLRACH